MLRYLIILCVLLLITLKLEAKLEKSEKIDFWTNTIDEIVINFRKNEITNELEMVEYEDDPAYDFSTILFTEKPQSTERTKNARGIHSDEQGILGHAIDINDVTEAETDTDGMKEANKDTTKPTPKPTIKVTKAATTTETTPKLTTPLPTTMKTTEPPTTLSTTLGTTTINPLSTESCAMNCSDIPHIACGKNWSLSPTCSPTTQLINLNDLQEDILDIHNTLRNALAGNETKFASASHMGTTQWHPELAAYAELNVMQCLNKHDYCHSTKKFRIPGQNLAFRRLRKDIKTIINKMINDWYAEDLYAEQTDMDNFSSLNGTNNTVIAHFVTIVNEKNTHIGCAAVSDHLEKQTIYFACNYARTNVFHQAIYEKGQVASKCLTGVNPKYTNLCSINEMYDYNNLTII